MKSKFNSKGLIGFSIILVLVIGIALVFNNWRVTQAEQYVDNVTLSEEDTSNLDNEAVELEEAKFAMTEEEIEQSLQSHRVDPSLLSVDYIDRSIDFEELYGMNSDIYAWIYIPETNIDYPILQHETSDSYYLNYNIDGSYGFPGCIYTEKVTSKDFTDPNTVIYGHNLSSGLMFTELHKFREKDFFDENSDIYIYTPEATYHYQVFAAHVYDDRHLLLSFDFSNDTVYESFLNSIFSIRDMSANINQDIEVTTEDKILTLSTCIGNLTNNRLLVHGVLVEIK